MAVASFFNAIVFDAQRISKPFIREGLTAFGVSHWDDRFPFALLWAPLTDAYEALFLLVDGFENDDDTFDAQLHFLTDDATGLLPHLQSRLADDQALWLANVHRKGGHVEVVRYNSQHLESRSLHDLTAVQRIQPRGGQPELTIRRANPGTGNDEADNIAQQMLAADLADFDPNTWLESETGVKLSLLGKVNRGLAEVAQHVYP